MFIFNVNPMHLSGQNEKKKHNEGNKHWPLPSITLTQNKLGLDVKIIHFLILYKPPKGLQICFAMYIVLDTEVTS